MTLKKFMKTYEGFDWNNGTVIFVNGSTPYIAEGAWRIVLDKYKDCELKGWTHNEKIMVMTF